MKGNARVISQIFISCHYTHDSNWYRKEFTAPDFNASLDKCCLPFKWIKPV